MRKVAMIPARLGSKRVPQKNLRFLGDKPLLSWVVETARDSGVFDEVWVNSESEKIGLLAKQLGVQFYKRSERLAQDGTSSEDFVLDFLEHTECDVLFQVTPTSPFLEAKDLKYASHLVQRGAKTVLSLKAVHAECICNRIAMNFRPDAPMLPSQDLCTMYTMCNGIFAWEREKFLAQRGAATYGRLDETTSFLMLEGDSALDIDTEEDFVFAEAVLARRRAGRIVPRYWTPTAHAETDVHEVLQRDGVAGVELDNTVPIVNLREILDTLPKNNSWAHRVVQSPSNSATIISQMPGEGNRKHYHPDWDEWWLILEGQFCYSTTNGRQSVEKGDLISIPRGTWHQIIAEGKTLASRLAVSRDGVEHVYRD